MSDDRRDLWLPLLKPKTKLQVEFEKFHEANPRVWLMFRKYARQVIDRGFRHYSARVLISRIRWHTDIETHGADGLKINDHHSPYYARLYHELYPEHDGLFRNRTLKGEEEA